MRKPAIAISAFSIVLILFCSISIFALVMVDKVGIWPESWPEELEPYRSQAETFDVATGNQESVYEIRFRDRREFEEIFPTILALKSKGAPLRLIRCSDTSKQATRMGLFENKTPAVRIFAPPFNTDAMLHLGIISGLESEWPESAKSEAGILPEYIVKSEDGSWVPEQKAPQAMSFNYRARIEIELVIDGNIIDLSRIYIPEDIPIIDNRMPSQKKVDIKSLVARIGTDVLSKAAEKVSHRLSIAARAPIGEIHPDLWSEGIRKLNPIRAYIHMMNIVVVLSEDNGVEEGLYIHVLISSYLPYDSNDGFTLTHLGDSVYRYRRDVQPAASISLHRKKGDKVLLGRVIDEQGNPVANARVFASYAHHGRTDGNGEFALRVSPTDSSGSIGPADFPMFVWAFEDNDPHQVAWTLIRHPASADRQSRRQLFGGSEAHTSAEWDQTELTPPQHPLVEKTHKGVKLVIEDENALSKSIPGDPGELCGDIDDDPKVRNIVLVMVPASVITGQVADEYGQPIGKARVQIETIEMKLGANTIIISDLDHDWKARAFAMTGDYGHYILGNLPMSWQKINLKAKARDYHSAAKQQFRNDGQIKLEGCHFQLIQDS